MVTRNINTALLSNLKLWQLKYSTFLLGLGTTGTRTTLENAVRQRLVEQLDSPSRTTRIVSVDMGIRNLAFCVLEAPNLTTLEDHNPNPSASKIHIKAWKKIDLLQMLSRNHTDSRVVTPESKDDAKDVLKAAFTPSVMSKTAYDTTQILLEHKPDAILIERQRFRSGGAAAIQEWTVRVNMLESMLWACLRTLSQTGKADAFPSVHEVSPAKVANFWLAGSASSKVALRPPQDIFEADDKAGTRNGESVQFSRVKAEKKDKIAIVKAWINRNEDHALCNEVALHFEGEAVEVAEAFATDKRQARNSHGHAAVEERFGKLDDLADCLLQGAAWVRWEENRLRMRDLLEE